MIYILSIIFSFILMEVAVIFSRKWLCSSFGQGALIWDVYITRIGTYHHELSHALFATITGAKVVEMSLWNPNLEDHTLGYVKICFSKDRYKASIQQFFSAIAPLVMACITTIFLGKLLLNPLFIGEANILEMISTIRFWIFLFIATPILYHATMSKSDILMAIKGSWFILLVLITIAIFIPSLIVLLDAYIKIVRNFVLIIMLIPITLGFLFRLFR